MMKLCFMCSWKYIFAQRLKKRKKVKIYIFQVIEMYFININTNYIYIESIAFCYKIFGLYVRKFLTDRQTTHKGLVSTIEKKSTFAYFLFLK